MSDIPQTPLLPCPFCGGKAVDRREIDDFPMIYCDGEGCFGPQTTAKSFDDALLQWNTRAPLSAQTGEEAVPNDTWGAFGYLVSRCASGVYHELIEKGKTDAQARNAVIHAFLDMACGEACRVARRDNREPNKDKWQSAVNGAWERAVRRTASQPRHPSAQPLYASPPPPPQPDTAPSPLSTGEVRIAVASKVVGHIFNSPDSSVGPATLAMRQRGLRIADEIIAMFGALSQPPATEQCERCQGNGEIVKNWDDYLHPANLATEEASVAECPDCDGTGHIDASPPATEQIRREVIEDALRWRQMPAHLQEFQIDYVGLIRAIDADLADPEIRTALAALLQTESKT